MWEHARSQLKIHSDKNSEVFCFPPALVAIGQIYTGRPNDILPAITQLDASEHELGNVEDVGLDFLTTAARLGDSVVDIFIIVIK